MKEKDIHQSYTPMADHFFVTLRLKIYFKLVMCAPMCISFERVMH